MGGYCSIEYQIGNNSECITKLQHYECQYNYQGFEIPLTMQKIVKSDKSNPGILVNVLFSNSKGICTTCRSECNGKSSKQGNFLMLVRLEKNTTRQPKTHQGCLSF